MSPVFLDCSVACLALALALALCETSTVNKCQVDGVESVGDKGTCEFVFLSLLPGLIPRSKVRLGVRGLY